MISFYIISAFVLLGLASALSLIACDKIVTSSVKPYEDGDWSMLSERNKVKVKRLLFAAFLSLFLAANLLWKGL